MKTSRTTSFYVSDSEILDAIVDYINSQVDNEFIYNKDELKFKWTHNGQPIDAERLAVIAEHAGSWESADEDPA